MSKALYPVNVIGVMEPRLKLNNQRSFVVVKGSDAITYYQYTAQAFSQSQFTFQTNPPNRTVVLDRDVFLGVPVTITFTQTPGVNTDNILQPGRDAFRSWPLQSVMNNAKLSLNGFPINIESYDIIHALERFHEPMWWKNGWGSLLPQMPDAYQNYADGDGANNNPLGNYGDNTSQPPRGAYPITVISNTPNSATITAMLYERVVIPPLLWDGSEAGGFSHLDTVNWDFIFNNNLPHMWSHSTASTSTIGAINVTFAQPTLYLAFLTRNLTQRVPPVITYPYFSIVKYVTQTQNTLAPNASSSYTTNNIIFNSVPRKLYMYAKQSNNVIYSSLTNMITSTDTFLQLNSVNVTWNNIQGVLSGASSQSLYDITMLNGGNMNYPEFNGLTQQLTAVAGNTTKVIGTVGSCFVAELSRDIPTAADMAPGSLAQINFTVQMDVTNINQSLTLSPDLYIIAVYDGIISLAANQCWAEIGVISPNDVLNAPISNMSYNTLEKVYGGGNFFNKFGEIASNVASYIPGIGDAVKDLAPCVAKFGQYAAKAAPLLGLGNGGILVGGCNTCGENCSCEKEPVKAGKMMAKRRLRDRLL